MKKLIILDLNGLLVHRAHKAEVKSYDKAIIERAITIDSTYVWKRPYMDTFLDFLLQHFIVSIWTSANRRNADRMVNSIMTQERREQLLFVWSQEDCRTINVGTEEFDSYLGGKDEAGAERPRKKHKHLFLKNLSRVWEAFPQFDESNTLLIDDSTEKTLDNPPGLHYQPETWIALNEQDDALGPEGVCTLFLKGLSDFQGNVSEYTKM